MRMTRNVLIISLFVFFLLSCSKQEINSDLLLDKNQIEINIVIEGSVLTITGHQFIRLTKPKYQVSVVSFDPISNANIYLSDGINKFYYFETEIPGEYLSIDSLKGSPEREYCIHVEFKENTYTACDIMKKNEKLDKLPINEITRVNSGRVYTHSNIHNFGYLENNIWIISSYFDSFGVPRANVTPKEIIQYPILLYTHKSALPQGLFANQRGQQGDAGEPVDSVEYIKLSVSDNYYKYLVSMFNLTDWSSGIFSTIPGNTYTNVSEGGTGYFFASDVKKIRVKYKDLKTIDE